MLGVCPDERDKSLDCLPQKLMSNQARRTLITLSCRARSVSTVLRIWERKDTTAESSGLSSPYDMVESVIDEAI
jgi:hypothetical protein